MILMILDILLLLPFAHGVLLDGSADCILYSTLLLAFKPTHSARRVTYMCNYVRKIFQYALIEFNHSITARQQQQQQPQQPQLNWMVVVAWLND